MRRRYLTKSRYKLARQCPTKLYYADHPETYENKDLDDDFLKALAEGGFQVGALAKLYFDRGIEVSAKDHQAALDHTAELLSRDRVVIYEAAFCYKNLFVRADVVVKVDNRIELIEVKAKSFEPGVTEFFDKRLLKKGHKRIVTGWQEYLYDIAFQTHVCRNAYPNLYFKPYLMLADKSAVATVDGLNQKFLLVQQDRHTHVEVADGVTRQTLGAQILRKVDVEEEVALIAQGRDLGEKTREELGMRSFVQEIEFLASHYESGEKIAPELGSKCKSCQFRALPDSDKKSGFKECWATELQGSELEGPFVFDIWNFRGAKDLIEQGRTLMGQVSESDIDPKPDDKPGLSASQRQWVQVELAQSQSQRPYVDYGGLRSEILSWEFPYHFIDFETTRVALPFNAGRRPYEQVAFQFSHHIVHSDGRIEHSGQYINDKRGEFPNFDFVRALRAELAGDLGTIFRYSHHENTVLCDILTQLNHSTEPDRDELAGWLKTITRSRGSSEEQWEGARAMVDMWTLLKRHYYHPLTNGSNSIKKVLPAILEESQYLQQKYQRPIYGTADGINSLNFKNWTWLKKDDVGKLIDPYKQLPKIFDGADLSRLEFTLTEREELADGAAAMTAYAKMQFSQMSEEERAALRASLLKYCELDTLAMVMLYEHWADITGVLAKDQAA